MTPPVGPSASTIRFRSRIDLLVVVLCFGPIVSATWMLTRKLQAGLTGEFVIAILIVALVLALILWMFLDTSYTLTATELLVRGGPVCATLPLATIRRVRRSRTLVAGPALSFRRLELDHGKYDTAIISP